MGNDLSSLEKGTILSLENAACLLSSDNHKLYLTLPRNSKYSKIYLYSKEDEDFSDFCCDLTENQIC